MGSRDQRTRTALPQSAMKRVWSIKYQIIFNETKNRCHSLWSHMWYLWHLSHMRHFWFVLYLSTLVMLLRRRNEWCSMLNRITPVLDLSLFYGLPCKPKLRNLNLSFLRWNCSLTVPGTTGTTVRQSTSPARVSSYSWSAGWPAARWEAPMRSQTSCAAAATNGKYSSVSRRVKVCGYTW